MTQLSSCNSTNSWTIVGLTHRAGWKVKRPWRYHLGCLLCASATGTCHIFQQSIVQSNILAIHAGYPNSTPGSIITAICGSSCHIRAMSHVKVPSQCIPRHWLLPDRSMRASSHRSVSSSVKRNFVTQETFMHSNLCPKLTIGALVNLLVWWT